MKITAQDVFTALYEAFHKLETITPPEELELTASRIEIEVYHERVAEAQMEVEKTLEEGSKILDRYVDSRIRNMIQRMIRDGDIKG